MVKLSIVIGVSQYSSLKSLPCCENDVELMKILVGAETRFNDHLIISESVPSSEVRDKIAAFIGKYKTSNGESIDEIFFYFSGHGGYDSASEEYYYCLSDYDPNKANSTSLVNSQLDDQFRALRPKVLAKVVDACQSGTRYIKADDLLSGVFEKDSARLESCYFLFSSDMNQNSFGDKHFSYFTKALLKAVADHPQSSIRYSDLINYLRDHFNDANGIGPSQKPQFVTQGAHLEVFCDITQELRQRLKSSLAIVGSTGPSKVDQLPHETPQLALSLLEKVKADAGAHCTEEEAMSLIARIKDFFQDQKLPDQAIDLFDASLSSDIYGSDVPDEKPIGQWAEVNEETYFVEPVRQTMQVSQLYEYLRQRYGSPISLIPIITGVKPRFVEKVIGADSTVTLPFDKLRLTAVPKFPNLAQTAFFVIPFLSRTHLTCFVAIRGYKRLGWDSWQVNDSGAWMSKEVPIREPEEIFEWLDQYINRFWEFSLEAVRMQFGGQKTKQSPVVLLAPVEPNKINNKTKDRIDHDQRAAREHVAAEAVQRSS
jgi:Caspase domain